MIPPSEEARTAPTYQQVPNVPAETLRRRLRGWVIRKAVGEWGVAFNLDIVSEHISIRKKDPDDRAFIAQCFFGTNCPDRVPAIPGTELVTWREGPRWESNKEEN